MNGADAHPADTSPLPGDRLDFPVVGIGASAGGISTLVHLFESVPSNPEMEFVDDTPDALESFAMLPEIEGAQVTAVGSAQEALKVLDQGQFDLLVSDVAMPDRDGYALVEALRANPATATLPVVALTGFGRAEDAKHALATGFDAHMPNRSPSKRCVPSSRVSHQMRDDHATRNPNVGTFIRIARPFERSSW